MLLVFLFFIHLLRSEISLVALLLCYVYVCFSFVGLCDRRMNITGVEGGLQSYCLQRYSSPIVIDRLLIAYPAQRR